MKLLNIIYSVHLFFRESIKTYDYLITLYVKPHAWSMIVEKYRHILSLALNLSHSFSLIYIYFT